MCHLCVRSLDEMNSLNRYRPEHLALVKEYLDKGKLSYVGTFNPLTGALFFFKGDVPQVRWTGIVWKVRAGRVHPVGRVSKISKTGKFEICKMFANLQMNESPKVSRKSKLYTAVSTGVVQVAKEFADRDPYVNRAVHLTQGVRGGGAVGEYPDFGRSVLGCIAADVCNEGLILQHSFVRDLQN